jgi:putative salt-induced outer membrane protein
MKAPVLIVSIAAALLAQPASAELPEPVRAMVEAAVNTGDTAKVEAVVEVARQTNPGEAREINRIYQLFLDSRRAQQAEQKQQEEREIRNAGLLDYWEGRGEAGASRSTGNTESVGFTGALALERIGIDWQHKLGARVDYQRDTGKTSREQYRASYEPNYNFSERGFVYGLIQYESDRFQGFSSRYSASGGIGYRVVEREGLRLSVKGGPALRRAMLIPEENESYIAALGAMSLDWEISEKIDLTQEASLFLRAQNSNFTSLTGVEAGIGGGLKARVSYSLQHETDPTDGALQTDTLSRFTVIYDF